MGTRQIKREVNHKCTHPHTHTQGSAHWSMTDADNVFVIPDPWPFQFLPQSFFKYSYRSVCTGLYVFMCVCVFLSVRLEGGVWFRLAAEGLSRHSFLLSDWTVWDAPIWKKEKNPERVCMSAHLYSPSDTAAIRLTFSPPTSSCLTQSPTHADSRAKCVRATMPPQQHPVTLTSCSGLWILLQSDYVESDCPNFYLHCLKDFSLFLLIVAGLRIESFHCYGF